LNADEIRALSDEELLKRLAEAQEELFNLRLRLVTKQLKNHQEIRKVRKSIARMKTILRQRELGIR
jgi:large subunit ribosomal protein L29